MGSFNRVVLMGNLTRDPELRYTPSGTAVAEFGLAMNRRWKNQSGEWQEEATFVQVEVWARQAETTAQYLSKGRQALVEGRLKLDRWETKDGEKRSRLKVVGERVVFVGSPRDARPGPPPSRAEAASAGEGPQEARDKGGRSTGSRSRPEHVEGGGGDAGPGFDMPDEEVPF